MLPGCGHIPSVEEPRQYRHAVAEFLISSMASHASATGPPTLEARIPKDIDQEEPQESRARQQW
jgi:hypothetical protein